MCGIVGFNWSDPNLLQAMMEKVRHRGPDESGFFIDKGISLGHQRLKIIDLYSGKQPIHNEEETIQIIFNGEIYNFLLLRAELERKGHSFYTNTDTEVIVHGYEEWGVNCVSHFNGMFAFALYDKTKKMLFLARDRFGVKPLYYQYDSGKLIFASEVKAILEYSNILPEVDPRALNRFFNFRFVPGDLTLFSGIKKLLPGNLMTVKDGVITIKQYYDLYESITAESEEMCISRLRYGLRNAVESRMVSDVPLGVFLSGGIDSASIVSLMSDYSDNIKTFTVSFSGEFETERTYAQKIANEYNTDHHEFFFNESDLEEIPKMVWHLDEPVGDAATLPTMVLSRYVKKYVTVVLAGEGGDETFAGYENQRIMTKCMIFDNAPKPVKQVVSFLNQFTPIDSNTHRLLNTISSVNIPHQYLSLISLFSKEELKKIGLCSIDNDVEPDIDGGLIKKIAIINDSPCDIHLPHTTDLFPNLSQLFPQTMKPLNQLLYFGFKTWLPNDFCLKADKMTMAYGVEERSPFLDYKLVNFAFTLQPSYKIQGNVGKYLLKRAMHSLLPQEIVDRKKHGFDVPMDGWFKGPLKSVLEDLLEERSHDLYDKEYIKFLLHKFQHSGNNYSLNFFNAQKLWSILVFEIWYRIFIEKIDYGKICL